MKIGDVYLMHGDGFEKWCAVVIKRADIGKDTPMRVDLTVHSKSGDKQDYRHDSGELPYYIAVIADDLDGCKEGYGWMEFRGTPDAAYPERGC
jgi:hypothetical protein